MLEMILLSRKKTEQTALFFRRTKKHKVSDTQQLRTC